VREYDFHLGTCTFTGSDSVICNKFPRKII